MAITEWYPAWVRRLGIVMAPNLADLYEAGGALAPAVARGQGVRLYLLPCSVWRVLPCGCRRAAVRGHGHGASVGSGLGAGETRR